MKGFGTNLLIYIFIMIVMLILLSCATVPVTNRQQLNLIPMDTLLSLSFSSYREVLSKSRLCRDFQKSQMVTEVGFRIQLAVEEYLKEHHKANLLKHYAWEFNLIDDDKIINAWCMPGGKVAVYTGILRVARDENGLAVVLGHEVSHAVANHGAERLSQGLLIQLGGLLLAEALKDKPEETKRLFYAAYGLGAQIGFLLPYSRLHETEADKMGLIFMAKAGYNPKYAVDFWIRMQRMGGGNKVPEFLSTHPSDETRIRNIKKFIPEAMKYYKPKKL